MLGDKGIVYDIGFATLYVQLTIATEAYIVNWL